MIKCKCWKCGNLSQCSSRIKGVHKNLAHIVSLAQPPSSTTSLIKDQYRWSLSKGEYQLIKDNNKETQI